MFFLRVFEESWMCITESFGNSYFGNSLDAVSLCCPVNDLHCDIEGVPSVWVRSNLLQ